MGAAEPVVAAAVGDKQRKMTRKGKLFPKGYKNGKFGVALLVGGPEDVGRELRFRLLERRNILIRYHFDWDHSHSGMNRPIPSDCDLVVILKDMIGHPQHDVVVRECKRIGLPFVRSQRKWSSLDHALRWYDITQEEPHPAALEELQGRKARVVRVVEPAPVEAAPPPPAPEPEPEPVAELPYRVAPDAEPLVARDTERPTSIVPSPAPAPLAPAGVPIVVESASAAAMSAKDWEALVDAMSTPDARFFALSKMLRREMRAMGIEAVTFGRDGEITLKVSPV